MAKHIKSTDPRKPAIVAALKQKSGCRKVTTVLEIAPGVYEGNCMNPNGTASQPGFHQVEVTT
jgi:hypothetical protein